MLGAAYEDEAVEALRSRLPEKSAPPQKASVWRQIVNTGTAAPRGIVSAAAEVAGSVAEAVGGFGQVLGAYPEAFGYSPTGQARQQADDARTKLLREGVGMNNDVGDALRSAGASYRPDPVTSNVAEQVLYGFARGASKVVGGAVVGGPIGIGAAALEEANTQSEELRQQGVPFGPRVAAGAVQGAGLGLAALPLVGTSLAQTAGLYLLGGPGGFMAQQALTREILQNAGQESAAAQFDPFDPVGLAVATLLPAAFTAYGLRGQRMQRAADSLPPLEQAEGRAPVDAPPAAEPVPSDLSPIAQAARAYPTEVVDAAMVAHLAERRAASNPVPDATGRTAEQHESALTRAEEQIARGEPVQVADLAPVARDSAAAAPRFETLMPIEKAREFAAEMEAKGFAKINIVQSVADLPPAERGALLAKSPEGEVRGAYFKNTDAVYVVMDRVRDPFTFGEVVMHEVFHRGIARTLGDDAATLLQSMHDTNPALQAATEAQMKAYGIPMREAVEEALADFAAKGQVRDLKGWDKMLGMIREWLARAGDALGIKINWTDDMVADFVAGTRYRGLVDGMPADNPKSSGDSNAPSAQATSPEAGAPAGTADPAASVPGAGDSAAEAGRVTTPVEQTTAARRIAEAQAQFPDLQVMLDGMDKPMPMAEFMAAVQREADAEVAGAPDLMDAATCALLNGTG